MEHGAHDPKGEGVLLSSLSLPSFTGLYSTFSTRQHKYGPIIAEAFAAAGLPIALGLSLAHHESHFDKKACSAAKGDLGRGGAYGVCQVTLMTARALGFKGTVDDLYDPAINADVASEICAGNAQRTKQVLGSDDWVKDMASLYNSGKILKDAPAFTVHYYVPPVLELYHRYDKALNLRSSSPKTALF